MGTQEKRVKVKAALKVEEKAVVIIDKDNVVNRVISPLTPVMADMLAWFLNHTDPTIEDGGHLQIGDVVQPYLPGQ